MRNPFQELVLFSPQWFGCHRRQRYSFRQSQLNIQDGPQRLEWRGVRYVPETRNKLRPKSPYDENVI